ncbi:MULTISPECIES: hypothetical protein [unclassified Rhizobium]|uniref:hypothetical protein n=1 Tax=unclassified Rhizobium TaxID=2613769 RepID=UPI002889710C|nr:MULTISPECIES: hypothetical protein [unclassified Rhizobium]
MSSSTVTEGMIDAVYDALAVMNMFTQRLADGEVSQNEGTDMSWILGSTKRRLEPILSVLEHIQNEQRNPQEMQSAFVPLELLSENQATTEKFDRRRQGHKGELL